MDVHQQYAEASLKTSDNLRSIAHSMQVRELSQLSLPEVDDIVERVGQVAPAGNIPGVILNGLARLPGRRPPAETVRRDINLLFKGVEKALDKAVYGAFFAGPAAVIWGYQNILKLAGKDPEDSFPEGVWQFYADYALREDTARHNNETHGFDTLLRRHQINLSDADRATAWMMAAIHCLHQYPDFLANEWRERKYIYLLQEVMAEAPDAERYARLYRQWQAQRPYGRGSDTDPSHTYAVYRRHKFDRFLADAMRDLTTKQRRQWLKRVQAASSELAAYQQQMSILAYLEPGPYGETRLPISLAQAQLGVINQGRYYLLPACQPGTSEPAQVEAVRAQIASLMAQPTARSATQLSSLAKIKRAELANLWSDLNATLRASLAQMRLAPILINTDQRSPQLALSELRQAERGIGDHALTVFDTGETFVFDQSHIFFDGAWGAALAEIMTREALSWAVYLDSLPALEEESPALKPLRLPFETAERRYIEQAEHITREVGVETEAAEVNPMLALRKLFKQRNDLIHLTVNDLLILYRAIHAVTYELDADLVARLEEVAQKRRYRDVATAVLKAFGKPAPVSPAILIPVDATRHLPRDRVYPMVFEVPLADLDLLQLHRRTMAALETYKSGRGDRDQAYTDFDKHQRAYLAGLAGFGHVMSQAKTVAISGQSASVGAVKLLANMPGSLQNLLNKIPDRIDILNDLLKGEEVFSNVGAVASDSTLTRFMTAKDDNEKKRLAWGVLTDAGGTMRITLRDFRPYARLLAEIGYRRLAVDIAQHYLDTYAQGLNDYVRDLRRITVASRETRLERPSSHPS